MPLTIHLNGRPVTNPAVKALLALGAMLVVAVVAALVIFIVLPLLGVTVALAMGVAAVAVLAVGLGLPLLWLCSNLVIIRRAPPALEK